MSWPVALIFGYALVALELVLPTELRLGDSSIAPSFVIPFVVFVSMYARPMTAYWTALLLGLSLDLLTPIGTEAAIIAGPRALATLTAAYLVVTVRTVINRNTLSLIVLSALAAAVWGVVIVAIFTLRAWYTPQIAWKASPELFARLLSAPYTALTAALLSLILFPSFGLFRFPDPYSRRATYKAY